MASDTSSTAAESIDSAGFWLSFVLIVGVSALEAFGSIIWTRICVVADGDQYREFIYVCGHEVLSRAIGESVAIEIAESANAGACGFYSSEVHNNETVIDMFGSLSFATSIAIRRFDPSESLQGPSELVKSFRELFGGDDDVDYFGNIVHLLIGLVDISLGIA